MVKKISKTLWIFFTITLVLHLDTSAHVGELVPLFPDLSSRVFEVQSDGTDSNVLLLSSLDEFKQFVLENSRPVVLRVFSTKSARSYPLAGLHQQLSSEQAFQSLDFIAVDAESEDNHDLIKKIIDVFSRITFGDKLAPMFEQSRDFSVHKKLLAFAASMPKGTETTEVHGRLLRIIKLLIFAYESPDNAFPLLLFFKGGKFILPRTLVYNDVSALRRDLAEQLMDGQLLTQQVNHPEAINTPKPTFWERVKRGVAQVTSHIFETEK